MSKKKSPVKEPKEQKSEESHPQPQEPEPASPPPIEEIPPEISTEQREEPSPPILTLESINQELQSLKLTIAQLQETLARKRKPPVSNGKVQILDKQTGAIYPSKNNAYQSLLKDGELKELVDKDIFGPAPQKYTFGWYALVRSLPDRFEEIKAEEKIIDGK